MNSDPALVGADIARLASRLVLLEAEVKHILLLTPEQGEGAVGRQPRQGLGKVEVVRELGSCALFAVAHGRSQAASLPVGCTKLAHEVSVLRKALDQNGAGALERRVRCGDSFLSIDKGLRRLLRIAFGV